jgi:signal transduction histidine kinase
MDAFIEHIIEFWIEPSQIIGSRDGWDYFRRKIILEGKEYLYYITKLDHIWLVPAMLFFYKGLKEHLNEEEKTSSLAFFLPLLPIILIDIAGSFIMIILSLLSLVTAIKLYMKDKENTLWNYLLWLSSSYAVFSLSRSIGHIMQHILVPAGYELIWRYLDPYSGSLNTVTFIVIGTVSLFFFRAYSSYLKMLEDKRKIEAVNADLTELNQELETMVAERTMSLMALTVADRVRNPAAVIRWTCKRILEKEKVPEKLGENLKDVIDESEKLESIVKDFETLLKSKQSMFRYEDINEIVRSVISIVKKEAAEKNVNLSVNLVDYPLKINAQKNLLRAAIFHIIRNAIEATPREGIITITTATENEKVILIVSDTGSGIPEKDIERIFDPFFSTKPFRFGMGLPLVKQIISEHLGDIKVESKLGKGTTIKLIFPVRWIEKK